MRTSWTKTEEAELTALVQAGKPFSEIAAIMTCTRSCIAGKVRRMGLQGPNSQNANGFGKRKSSIIAFHDANPSWDTKKVAQAVGCTPAIVRTTNHRYDLNIPPSREFGKSEIAFGFSTGPARAAIGGFPYPSRTVEELDIEYEDLRERCEQR